MEKSHFACFPFLYICIILHNIKVHINHDLFWEQMNHSVVITLKINKFMLTFKSIISLCFAAKKEI